MKKTIITFKAITSDRRIVHKNIAIEHEFEVIPSRMWRGIELPATSIEEQVMNQLDETDKRQIMLDYDFDIILDYYPKKPRKKKADEIAEFMKYCEPIFEAFPHYKRAYEAIISEYKDNLFGKRKSNKTKLDEVMSIHSMIMKGAQGTIDMALKILNQTNQNLIE